MKQGPSTNIFALNILYALLHHDTGIRIIKSCGGNVDRIKQDLEEFFSQQETVGEDNSLNRQERSRGSAFSHHACNSSGKASADVGDILVAIHRESDLCILFFTERRYYPS